MLTLPTCWFNPLCRQLSAQAHSWGLVLSLRMAGRGLENLLPRLSREFSCQVLTGPH